MLFDVLANTAPSEILGNDYTAWKCHIKDSHSTGALVPDSPIWSRYMFMTEHEIREEVEQGEKLLGKHTHFFKHDHSQ